MSEDTKVRLLLYLGLNSDEQSKLETIDGRVFDALLKSKIMSRAIWTGRGTSYGRSVRLNFTGAKTPVALFSSSEIMRFTTDEIIRKIQNTVENMQE